MVAWTVKVCVLMLGFLIALQRQQCFSYATEILRALRFYKHIRRPFHFQAGITPQDATCISFCPCRNSWMKFQYAVYCYLNIQLESPGVSIRSCFLFDFCFCYFPWSEAVWSIRSSPVASTRTENFTRVPTKSWKLCDWSIVSEIFFFVTYLYFLSATKMCHSLNELVNRAMVGRSRWTTIVRGSLFFFFFPTIHSNMFYFE